MGSQAISDDVRLVVDSLRRVVQLLRESSRAVESQLGLSGAQLFVLSQLKKQGGLSLNQLAELTATHQSSVSVVVSRLVERGLVARRSAAADARKLELSLTAEGRRVVENAPDPAQERLFAAIESLPARLRGQLVIALSTIVESMQLEEQPPMFFEDPPGKKEARRGRRG